MPDDIYFMERALELASKGEGKTRPNPPVGAVLQKGGRIVGEGYHRKAGGPHAEVAAIKAAGSTARNSVLYVTLEPCSTHGRTPPCTEAIKEAGIKEIVVSVRDPNPEHRGKGLTRLRRSGINVTEGVCSERGQLLIEPFAKWITSGLPFLTLKLGMTVDGRIADASGSSRWITGKKARDSVHRIRRAVDAVMIGSGTAVKDDPSLLCAGRRDGSLWRVVVDSKGKLTCRSQLLTDSCVRSTVIATTSGCSAAKVRRYEKSGASVWSLPSSQGKVSLKALLRRLGREGALHVLCEGGGELAHGLVKAGLVDRYVFYMAPKFLGGRGVPAVGGKGWTMKGLPAVKFTCVAMCGQDIVVTARPSG